MKIQKYQHPALRIGEEVSRYEDNPNIQSLRKITTNDTNDIKLSKTKAPVSILPIRDNTKTIFSKEDHIVSNSNHVDPNKEVDDNILGLLPGIGDALQALQVGIDLQERNYGRAALNAGLLVLPNFAEIGRYLPGNSAKRIEKLFEELKSPILTEETKRQIQDEWRKQVKDAVDDAFVNVAEKGNNTVADIIRDANHKIVTFENPEHVWHSTKAKFNIFEPGKINPNTNWPSNSALFHVGTQQAAIDRAKDISNPRFLSLYVHPKKFYPIDDSDIDSAKGLLNQMERKHYISNEEKESVIEELMKLNTLPDATKIPEQNKVVRRFLSERFGDGFGIKYINEFEDKGSMSYGVLNSNQLKLTNGIVRDDSGDIIKLSNRDNFINPDIRYKQGGILSAKFGIHIKPENKGKLTRLKRRTGKSEAELYKTGSPEVRKMITFARNSRKWKHK